MLSLCKSCRLMEEPLPSTQAIKISHNIGLIPDSIEQLDKTSARFQKGLLRQRDKLKR